MTMEIKAVLQMINEEMVGSGHKKEDIRECMEECVVQIQNKEWDGLEKFLECTVDSEEKFDEIRNYIKRNIDNTYEYEVRLGAWY